MESYKETAKILFFIGLILVFLSLVIYYKNRIPLIGRLPGDIVFKRKGLTIYVPIMTSILISLFLSLILFFFSKWNK